MIRILADASSCEWHKLSSDSFLGSLKVYKVGHWSLIVSVALNDNFHAASWNVLPFLKGLNLGSRKPSTLDQKSGLYSQIWNCADSFLIPPFMYQRLDIPKIVCLFGCSKIGTPIPGINKLLTNTWMWKLEAANFHFWEYINRNQIFILDSHWPFICSVHRLIFFHFYEFHSHTVTGFAFEQWCYITVVVQRLHHKRDFLLTVQAFPSQKNQYYSENDEKTLKFCLLASFIMIFVKADKGVVFFNFLVPLFGSNW